MSDLFHRSVVRFGRHVFWVSGRPTLINPDATRRPGAFILASNHTSPFDVPLLMCHCRRFIDFVSITEVFENRFTAWFYGSMNAFPLDRSKPDAPTVRTILDRLARGRVVGMFPEGGLRTGEASVVRSRKIRPGIGRLALMANVPIVPAVVIDSANYRHATSWLPLRRVRYGVAFGQSILPEGDAAAIEQKLVDSIVELHRQLTAALVPSPGAAGRGLG